MQNEKISMKIGYVRTDGWRGYSQPTYAVGGANDTGTWSDSPCPSNVREKEINGFTDKLRDAGIKYKTKWCESSNVFCMHQYVVVAEKDHAAAYLIAKEHQENTRLFYACEMLVEKKESVS